MLYGAHRRAKLVTVQITMRGIQLNAVYATSRARCRCHSTRSSTKTIVSGIQPTGVPHLGNYLGALRQWKKLQDEAAPSTQLLYSIADLHALTARQNATQLRNSRREMMAALLAIGLKPESCTIFFQSAVNTSGQLLLA